MRKTERVAVVGSGIAGLSAAWLMRERFDVRLFERNDYFGGHTHTILAGSGGERLPVDTGFIVYNDRNYPHLTALLAHLGVGTRDSDMSFSASIGSPLVEYSGSDFNALFAQRRNLVNRGFLGMVWDILRFNRLCKRLLRQDGFGDLTVGDLLRRERLGGRFRDHYLLPMAASIWSCPPRSMLAYPAQTFAQFFENHGLLDLRDRPRWKTVEGGSHTYVKRLLADLGPRARCRDAVRSVARKGEGIEVRLASGAYRSFDRVILACHADEALALLGEPLANEKQVLSCFRYQPNRALLHRDERLMPVHRRVWSSWNYLASEECRRVQSVSVTYWMNRLQGLTTKEDYFVTLNPLREPRPSRVIAEMTYEHPVFDRRALDAQRRLADIQGQDRIWYTGSYFGYGFHEDALRASVGLAERFGIPVPWLSADRAGCEEVAR